MKISAKDYANALLELSEKNPKNISEVAKNFHLYLLRKRKIKILPLILEKLDEIEKEKMQIFEIEVETSSPLTPNQKKKIMKFYDKHKVIIQEKINPKLLGGIVVKVNNTVLDGSLQSNLERLKEEMWQTPIK